WPPHRVPQLEVLPGELAAGEWIEPAAALARWQTAEVIAAPPILHLLTVLAEDGPQAGLPRLRDPAEADLGPYRRIEFRPGVILVPVATATLPPATHTNCYLLGGEAAVLVDPGSTLPTEQERLLAALAAARDRLGRRVQAIWLTHHHPDHVGGAEAARQALGVPLLAHPATAERLAPLGLRVDDTLAHEQRLRLGDMPVRVLHTPGHARGHLCFLDERHGSLLCGDMVSALSTIVIDPPEGHMGDYLRSLESLIQSGAQTLFPSHGPVLADAATTLRRYVEHRRWREGRILEAWRSGLREPAELLPQVYEEVPRLVWPLAERQLVAHLEHLREQGEIR
ncbi:MAG TPA: MBL fold metallo-hydrolase, partial [Thermoanaerobaculia bacterium]|nr:MBL fold metallo-hydrolase [Thermoanaerobaculia bacterium]